MRHTSTRAARIRSSSRRSPAGALVKVHHERHGDMQSIILSDGARPRANNIRAGIPGSLAAGYSQTRSGATIPLLSARTTFEVGKGTSRTRHLDSADPIQTNPLADRFVWDNAGHLQVSNSFENMDTQAPKSALKQSEQSITRRADCP